MPKQKLTPWFPADVRPVHIGWYHTDIPCTSDVSDWNWWWNGKVWLSGPKGWVTSYQNRKWRGLAEKPKG